MDKKKVTTIISAVVGLLAATGGAGAVTSLIEKIPFVDTLKEPMTWVFGVIGAGVVGFFTNKKESK